MPAYIIIEIQAIKSLSGGKILNIKGEAENLSLWLSTCTMQKEMDKIWLKPLGKFKSMTNYRIKIHNSVLS